QVTQARKTNNFKILTLSILDMEDIFYIHLYLVRTVSFLPQSLFVSISHPATVLWGRARAPFTECRQILIKLNGCHHPHLSGPV
ncbi:MAG: hypothetical protein V1255_03785, partial [Alphaproteobacteria bacterium]|nr:hypothetical protein [Alphaproteobacteria bacterium]